MAQGSEITILQRFHLLQKKNPVKNTSFSFWHCHEGCASDVWLLHTRELLLLTAAPPNVCLTEPQPRASHPFSSTLRALLTKQHCLRLKSNQSCGTDPFLGHHLVVSVIGECPLQHLTCLGVMLNQQAGIWLWLSRVTALIQLIDLDSHGFNLQMEKHEQVWFWPGKKNNVFKILPFKGDFWKI